MHRNIIENISNYFESAGSKDSGLRGFSNLISQGISARQAQGHQQNWS